MRKIDDGEKRKRKKKKKKITVEIGATNVVASRQPGILNKKLDNREPVVSRPI